MIGVCSRLLIHTIQLLKNLGTGKALGGGEAKNDIAPTYNSSPCFLVSPSTFSSANFSSFTMTDVICSSSSSPRFRILTLPVGSFLAAINQGSST
ncbi:unnamed protein product [Linum trigynum]|uniref:Uncharacterized protein n=1 Tax=Linum trigynum TaxID=586398 RepID=A0AAV2EPW5_9ROSI